MNRMSVALNSTLHAPRHATKKRKAQGEELTTVRSNDIVVRRPARLFARTVAWRYNGHMQYT
ncbi:MAG: hypothetical protein ACOC0B_03055, partial [bacterium]